MDKKLRINGIIKQLHDGQQKIDVDSIILQSLFSSGGTLTDNDKSDILDCIWAVKDKISAKAIRKYPDGITGLAEGIAINAYFNPQTQPI